ncbi:hypothetical protein [Pseudomonas aeruginosa]|uniref:DUF7666 domain-containing protein n=1 Tax=Pseudomonas aeruginosa TaxID=287 RepID=UPI001F2D56EE|nr:hypothetical protein [Pseudomonas aeruginosa]
MTRKKKTEVEEIVTAYKGFKQDLTCRGYQFEIGGTYKHEGEVEACASGFHSCEYPLDVFGYYAPGDSRFAIVKASGQLSRHDDDSKIASATLVVEAEISMPTMISRAIDWIMARLDSSVEQTVAGDTASNTGNRSAASNTGDYSAASNTGDYSAASNTGDYSAASRRYRQATTRQPATPATSRQPATPATSRQPATPATTRQPATPATSRQPATPATARQPATPATSRQPATPATSRQPATPATTRQPATPATTRQPATPATARQPATPATTRQPATPATARQPATPATARQPRSAARNPSPHPWVSKAALARLPAAPSFSAIATTRGTSSISAPARSGRTA